MAPKSNSPRTSVSWYSRFDWRRCASLGGLRAVFSVYALTTKSVFTLDGLILELRTITSKLLQGHNDKYTCPCAEVGRDSMMTRLQHNPWLMRMVTAHGSISRCWII